MLKVFRDNLKYLSWVLWLVIIVFVLFLFTDFGSIAPAGGMNSTAAVRVGDYEISYADFERAYRQQEQRFEQAYGDRIDPDLARQLGLYNQVLEALVAEKVLQAEGDRMGIEISDEEVRDAIVEIPVFQDADGNFVGEETYLTVLRNNRLTPDDFERSVRQGMLTDRVRAVLNQNIYVSDAEVERAYRDQAERARIRFLRLDGGGFADQVAVDDSEIAAWFEEHSQDFEVPEKRVADYLLVDWGQLQSSVEITDAEVANYYRENEEDYRREAEARARHILVRTGEDRTLEAAKQRIEEARARIERGDDFAAVAAEISDDPGSKDRGGDLGAFGRGQMVPQFEEAVFSAQPGDLVGPVETNFGVHLIEVLGVTEGGQQPLEQVATSIRNRLAAERARSLAESKARELAARIEREELTETDELGALTAGEEGVSFLTTQPFGRNDLITGLGRAPAFATLAFDTEPGETAGPIQVAPGWVILRVAEVQEAHVPELALVRDRVRSAVAESKKVELARQALEEAREQLAGGASLDDVAAQLGVEVEESDEFGRTGAVGSLGAHRDVSRAALELDAGAVGGPIVDGDGAVLFEVVERQSFDPARFEAEKAATREALLSQRAGEMLSALISARREEMGVVYDPAFIENFQSAQS